MKIRIKDNTLRLRLTQSEVKDFGEKGFVEAKTKFGVTPDSTLSYSIVKTNNNGINASFKKNKIEIVKGIQSLNSVRNIN